MSACEPGGPKPLGSAPAASAAVTVEVNQSRDQYGKQAIQIQLTNTTAGLLKVTAARLSSPLFKEDIVWHSTEGVLELPPRQPKSLPANLPAAACGHTSPEPLKATIQFSDTTTAPQESTVDAGDPFNVLPRNAEELCLAADATAVAAIVLNPGLEVAPDGRTAVVRLVITPSGDTTESRGSLIIESIDGTTLLAEPPTDPWPRNVTITAGTAARDLALRIRPARCDPHAVAEDKVGTLLPLRVSVGAREGLLKIPAPNELRGRIYDFVTAACAGQ